MAQPARRSRRTGQANPAEPARKGASEPPARAAVNSSAESASGAGSCATRIAGPVRASSTPHAVTRRFRIRASPAAAAAGAHLHGAFPWRAPSERGVGVRGRQP